MISKKIRVNRNLALLTAFILNEVNLRFLFYLMPLFIFLGKWELSSLYVFILFLLFIIESFAKDEIIWIPSWVMLFSIFVFGFIAFLKSTHDGDLYFLGTIVAPIFLFLMLINTIKTPTRITILMNLLIVDGVILSLISLYTALFRVVTFKERLSSVWSDFNIFAGFLMVLVFFSLTFLLNSRKNHLKFFYFVSLFILLIGLYLTESRGVWLASLFAISFYVLKRPKAIVPAILFIGIIGYLFFPVLKERFFFTRYFASDASSIGRLQAWYATILMLKDYWLLGAGFDGFLTYKDHYLGFFRLFVPHSHNTYLRLWLELGIFGFISYMYFFVKGFIYSFKVRKKVKDNDSISLSEGLQLSFMGLSISFMFEPNFSLYGNSTIVIWMLISFSFILFYNSMNENLLKMS